MSKHWYADVLRGIYERNSSVINTERIFIEIDIRM